MKITGVVLTCAASLCAAEMRISIRDDRGEPAWARLEVRGPDGKMFQPASGAVMDRRASNRPGGQPWYLGSFVVRGEARVEAPPGRYLVVAERGLEHERVERGVDVTAEAPATVEIRIKRWTDMPARGWWSGDMHVHRPPEDAGPLALAEDLNVSVVFTMWNKRNLWADRPLPDPPISTVSPRHLLMLMNAEDERGGGAWMMHGIARPLELGVDGRWFPAGIDFVRQVRPQRERKSVLPWFDSEKPIWWEAPVMMALATPDSFGLLHNHFNQYGISDSEAWGRPRDQKVYPGRPGFVDYVLGLYYRYLNLGFRVPASAGSASGVLPNPVGYNRVYAKLDGALSVEKWYNAIRSGGSFVTNGPMLFFNVRGGRATVEVKARELIDRVELVANGKVIERFTPPPGTHSLGREFRFDPNGHSWVAARCFVQVADTIRLAHSNPVWLSGKWDARDDAQYFVGWIDELIRETENDPKRFTSAREKDQILALYREGRAFYAARSK